MESKHTKTPWRVSQGYFIDSWIGDGMFQEVAWCGDCEHGDREVNARHIVRCVNSHGKLVEALDSAATMLEVAGYVNTAKNHRELLASLKAEKGGEL